MGKACTNYDSSCFSAAPIMSELVCVTSGCKEGGVGIETRGARRIAFCAKSCDLWTVIDVFDGNGAPSGPNYLLFVDADRLADSLWVGLGSGSRLDRMRPYLELPRELWIQIFGKSWSRAVERKGPVLICIH